jgi:hypothetical protein
VRDLDELHAEMIKGRGVRDPLVLTALAEVPREAFLPGHLHAEAYDGRPLRLAEGKTAMPPYVVACMIEALGLRGGEKVLVIGAGTSYAAASCRGSLPRSSPSNDTANRHRKRAPLCRTQTAPTFERFTTRACASGSTMRRSMRSSSSRLCRLYPRR